MRRIVWIVPAVLLSAAAQAQMLPETDAFLRKIGLDPDSPLVVSVAYDRVGGADLNSLAAAGDEAAMHAFLITRRFLFELRVNPAGPHRAPESPLFDPDTYMTQAERNEAMRVFFSSFEP